ncbi:MAG: hypothetical protein HKN16_04375, partial [Saprospiraceae bacterium]|nr:hypothetical protein [Saprospiraceae bacterium]
MTLQSLKYPNSSAISAGHDHTLDSARNILIDGGNAVDAAIAAFATACIAEPCMASAGAGGFAVVYMDRQDPVLVDFFCQTPKSKNRERDLDFLQIPVDFGEAKEVYYGGLASMALPGSVAGLFALHDRWGSRPMRMLFEQAIHHSREGVPINDFQHHDLSLLSSVFDFYPRGGKLFKPDGELIKVGEVLRLQQFADFLDYLGREGKDAFYKGEVAGKLISACEENGGFLSREDLESYSVEFRKPLQKRVKNLDVFTNGFPSIGGPLMTAALEEANKLSTFSEMIIPSFLRMESFQKDPQKIAEYLGRNRRGATSHFNILDRWGNAVALT